MTRINTNVASLRGLRNLQRASGLLDTSLTRLSTGLKINSGKDSPSGLIASETLRSEITAIEQSIKNSNRANNVIGTADAALGEITNLLNQVRGLIQEGLNDGALSLAEKNANQLQIDTALSAINRIAANTTFAGDKLIDGSKAFTTQSTTADAAKLGDFQVNEAIFGSNATIEINTKIITSARQGELRYSGGALSQGLTLEVSGASGSQVLFLGGSSSVSNIKDAINSVTDITGVEASSVDGLVISGAAKAGSTAVGAAAIPGSLSITDTGDTITFTDNRNGGAGDPATTIDIVFADGTANSALSFSSVVDDGNGNYTITVELADANGTSTTTVDDLVNLVNNDATGNGILARQLISASGTGTTGTIVNADDGQLSASIPAATVTFTDARNSGNGGSAATLGGEISVQFVNAVTTANSASTVTVGDADENGNIIISVELGNDANGVVNATVDDIVTLITNDVDAAALVTAAGSGTSILGTTTGVQQLLGGHDGDNNNVTINDARAPGSVGTLSVDFNAPGTANQSLSIVVSPNGNDNTVTVNLATDANGNVTTTAADLVNLLNTGQDAGSIAARGLISASFEGDGSEALSDSSGAQNVAANSGTIVLKSSDFGSSNFVEVNVLSGSFATTLSDGTTTASRNKGSDIVAQINGQAAIGNGLEARVRTSSLTASVTFNQANNVANTTATVTVTGGGSLFQIGQEVSTAGQVGIGIEAINTARLGGISGKLYELASGGGKSLLDVGPNVQGSDLVDIVEQAIQRVTTLRGRLGAVQKNVIETNISTLGVALENIAEARSQIIDTDFAEETANLTRAQILSQSGISVLAIANQTPAQVLSLLG